jgi:hypothetical protein
MFAQLRNRRLVPLFCFLVTFALAACTPVQPVSRPGAPQEAQSAGAAGAAELPAPEAPAGAAARTPGEPQAKTPREASTSGVPANDAPEAAADATRLSVLTPGERLELCFGLAPADAEAVLGEPVAPEWSVDTSYGYCTYAAVAGNAGSLQDDLLPVYGPVGEHRYLAVSVWPVGSATDPLMYLAFAILDREHARLSEFLQEFSGAAGLEELARVESQLPNLEQEFLAEVGDGALWYWQGTSAGDHLAGLYVMVGSQRVAVQALVAPERSSMDVRNALTKLVTRSVVPNNRQ